MAQTETNLKIWNTLKYVEIFGPKIKIYIGTETWILFRRYHELFISSTFLSLDGSIQRYT